MDIVEGPRRRALPILTLPHLWAIAALVAVFAATGLSTIAVGDFWWHLKVGQMIAESRQIPAVDTFSFIAQGTPFAYQQWVGELYFYLLYRVGGLELVVLTNTLALTSIAGIVLLASWESSRSLRIASLCTMAGMLVALPNRDVRPQVLGFLFFALFYLMLSRYRRGIPVPLWTLPLLTVVWTNVHGSSILGFGLCAVVFGAEVVKSVLGMWPGSTLSRKRLVILGMVTASLPVAMLLNPWGPGFFGYVTTIQSNPVIQTSVTEWFAPDFRNPEDMPFFLALVACAAVFALSPRARDLTDTALFVVFAMLALQAVRNSAWFGIVAAPLAAQQVAAIMDKCRATRQSPSSGVPIKEPTDPSRQYRSPAPSRLFFTNYLFLAILLTLASVTMPWIKPNLSLPERIGSLISSETPVDAVQYISTHYSGERFFHPVTYGSYMIWPATARPPVFVDGRIELYSQEVWEDYIQISLAQGWEERLAKYGIRHVLLAREPWKGFQLELLQELEHSPQWGSVYQDDVAMVFVRTP